MTITTQSQPPTRPAPARPPYDQDADPGPVPLPAAHYRAHIPADAVTVGPCAYCRRELFTTDHALTYATIDDGPLCPVAWHGMHIPRRGARFGLRLEPAHPIY